MLHYPSNHSPCCKLQVELAEPLWLYKGDHVRISGIREKKEGQVEPPARSMQSSTSGEFLIRCSNGWNLSEWSPCCAIPRLGRCFQARPDGEGGLGNFNTFQGVLLIDACIYIYIHIHTHTHIYIYKFVCLYSEDIGAEQFLVASFFFALPWSEWGEKRQWLENDDLPAATNLLWFYTGFIRCWLICIEAGVMKLELILKPQSEPWWNMY